MGSRIERALRVACGAAWLLLWPAGARAQPICEGGLYRAWSFQAGAAVSAAAVVTSSGQVTVATHEGTLHSVAADGGFLWSYTVGGTLLAGVHVTHGDRFIAGDTLSGVTAIGADGRPHWVFRAPTAIERTAVDPTRGLFFYTRGRGLYALSSRAGLLWSVNLRAHVLSPLAVDDAGAVWILTADDRLHRLRTPYFHDAWPVDGWHEPELLALIDGAALVLDRGRLSVIGEGGRARFVVTDVETAAVLDGADGAELVVHPRGGGFVWLNAKGVERARMSAPRFPGAKLRATQDQVFVAGSDGTLSAFARSGAKGRCRVSSAPLMTPQLDTKRERLVVTAGDGQVAAVSFEAWR
jgi:outer membrane protein assembly factor BamB